MIPDWKTDAVYGISARAYTGVSLAPQSGVYFQRGVQEMGRKEREGGYLTAWNLNGDLSRSHVCIILHEAIDIHDVPHAIY
jgi:hypothetical protein